VKNRRIKLAATLASILALTIVWATPAFAADSADVTVTATPTYIALTNSEATWALGTVAASTTYWWTADGNEPDPNETYEAADMKSTITNTGSAAEDIDIEATDFTGGVGWTLDDAAVDADQVMLGWQITGGSTGTINYMESADAAAELKDDLASSGTVKWMMQLKTGTFTDGDAKSCTVTVSARAHS